MAPVIDLNKVIDTLVVSRLIKYQREGGHSLEAYGEKFGVKKIGSGIEDFSVFTDELLQRCISDTEINLRVYNYLKRWIYDPRFKSALRTEHELERLCSELHDNGFPFDKAGAEALACSLRDRLGPIDSAIRHAFPPRARAIREVTPVLTQKGTLSLKDFRFLGPEPDLSQFNGGPFTRIEFEDFNPLSPKQVVTRLNEAGWKPTEKTKGHLEFLKTLRKNSKPQYEKSVISKENLKDKDSLEKKLQNFAQYGWKISEENLNTLPDSAPEGARKLREKITLESRLSDIKEWLSLYNETTGAIHGDFFSIGAWTQRMAHSSPNTANIPVPQHKDNETEFEKLINEINLAMRGLFHAMLGNILVGVDADGIQMRIFAHYVNDERLIKALISGKKEDGSDIHSVHQRALGSDICRSRDAAKTFIYAWLLGAGIGKVSQILECSHSAAAQAVDNFLNFYPGLLELKRSRIPEDAARGYFTGLDGRLVACDNSHLMLAGYLQNGEKIIMARAANRWNKILKKEGIPFWFRNFVHDEHQTETIPEYKNFVASTMIESIVIQGEELNMNCPLAANAKFGLTWAETH